jgi:hypothetical protein
LDGASTSWGLRIPGWLAGVGDAFPAFDPLESIGGESSLMRSGVVPQGWEVENVFMMASSSRICSSKMRSARSLSISI